MPLDAPGVAAGEIAAGSPVAAGTACVGRTWAIVDAVAAGVFWSRVAAAVGGEASGGAAGR